MTAPLSDEARNGERPIYVRGTPEYQAEWLRIYAARRQVQRALARLSHQARSAARKVPPRPEPPEETPEQHAARMRIIAERRERKKAEQRRRPSANDRARPQVAGETANGLPEQP